jgi:hypothetical protein
LLEFVLCHTTVFMLLKDLLLLHSRKLDAVSVQHNTHSSI